MSTLPTHDDPGLQPERTTLSWSRTVLATCVCSATLVKFVETFGPAVFIAVGILLLGAVAILVTQRHRYAVKVEGINDDAVEPNAIGVLTLTSLVLCFGAITIMLMLAASPG
ncbi:MAG: DUF202 domain-containing protein [Corynebacterium glucuronolyticum]|nr:DUF202 domain-containing protein [Corynebacterium glucuronolyticum]